MRINNNTAAFNVWTSYTQNVDAMKSSMSKLSTGQIKNTDDPAGVGISERMRAQISGTAMARQNTENAVSLLQTADSWLQKVNDMVSRMKALAIEANGIMSSTDKENVQTEFKAMQERSPVSLPSTHQPRSSTACTCSVAATASLLSQPTACRLAM